MPDIKLLLRDLNTSLGFHIPGSKAKYLETVIPLGIDAFVESILAIEGLDREDDVRKELQAKVMAYFSADLLHGLRKGNDRPRKVLTLPRSRDPAL